MRFGRCTQPSATEWSLCFPDDGVVAITGVVGIGCCALHRRNTGRCAKRLVRLLALFLYLHHASGINFLTRHDIVSFFLAISFLRDHDNQIHIE